MRKPSKKPRQAKAKKPRTKNVPKLNTNRLNNQNKSKPMKTTILDIIGKAVQKILDIIHESLRFMHVIHLIVTIAVVATMILKAIQ